MKVQITDYCPTWRDSFEWEKKLLEVAIGENSGVVEHIGSTSVIGLAAKPIIDIMIGLRDFSVAETLVSKIEALGYKYIPEYEVVMPDRRYFKKKAADTSTHHVHMVMMGGEFWERHLLFRDFLRANPKTADEYAALKKNLAKLDWKNKNDYTDAKTIFIKNIENKARKQKSRFSKMNAFAEIQKVDSLFSGLSCQWFVCGGWAIDLFLNRVTRSHKDIDIAIARRDQFEMRGYLQRRGWKVEKAVNGELISWADGERLELPVHGVWCRNEKHDPNFIEILLNEIDDDQFRFRRDESIKLPRESMSFSSLSGLPVLAPEIVLLYKSNCPEEYDADFQNAVQLLGEESRVWLKAALDKLFARHPWAERL